MACGILHYIRKSITENASNAVNLYNKKAAKIEDSKKLAYKIQNLYFGTLKCLL